MAISLVQSNNGTGAGPSTWGASFSSGVTAGNTLFLAVFSYASGSAITAGSPTYNGSAYPAASQLIAKCSTGSGNVFCAIWMFPNITTGGGTTLDLTSTNGNIDSNVGWVCYEVAGLGSSPTLDRSAGNFATGGNTSSGTTSAIQHANEFIIGAAVGYAVAETAASGFTNSWNGTGNSDYCEAGYQIATSSGGTYAYATNTGTSADWAAGIVTVYAGSAPPTNFSFVGSNSNTGNSVSSLAVTAPGGIQSGDLIVCYALTWMSSGSITQPTGFTMLASGTANQSSSHQYNLSYKLASGSEPPSYTVNFSTASNWPLACIYVLRGNDTTTPIANTYTLANASGYVTTLPAASGSLNATTDATLYIYSGIDSAASGTITPTLPAGLSNQLTVSNSSAGGAAGIGWAVNNTSPGSATTGTAVDYADFLLDITVSFAVPVAWLTA